VARAATLGWVVLDERPSSSMITGTGTIIVRRLFSMMDVSYDNEEKGLLVLMTSIVYLGMMRRSAPVERSFQGRREGGEEDATGERFSDST
jgi:hypothetical protein